MGIQLGNETIGNRAGPHMTRDARTTAARNTASNDDIYASRLIQAKQGTSAKGALGRIEWKQQRAQGFVRRKGVSIELSNQGVRLQVGKQLADLIISLPPRTAKGFECREMTYDQCRAVFWLRQPQTDYQGHDPLRVAVRR